MFVAPFNTKKETKCFFQGLLLAQNTTLHGDPSHTPILMIHACVLWSCMHQLTPCCFASYCAKEYKTQGSSRHVQTFSLIGKDCKEGNCGYSLVLEDRAN